MQSFSPKVPIVLPQPCLTRSLSKWYNLYYQEESLKIDAISTRLEGKDTILLQVQPGQIVPESEGLQYKGTPILPEIPTREETGENTPVQLEAQLETEKREIHAETPKVELKGLEVVKPKVENPITIQSETPSD